MITMWERERMTQTCDGDAWTKRPGLAACACAVALPLALAACSLGESLSPTARAPSPTGVSRDALVGSWGIASFHTDKDRKRTEAQAKAQCSQPYRISRGPNDGVMMHVADDPKLYELRLKAGPDGRTYVGFESPAGDPQDRELLSITPNVLTMRFVDPDAHRRYGTFVFVRCS